MFVIKEKPTFGEWLDYQAAAQRIQAEAQECGELKPHRILLYALAAGVESGIVDSDLKTLDAIASDTTGEAMAAAVQFAGLLEKLNSPKA